MRNSIFGMWSWPCAALLTGVLAGCATTATIPAERVGESTAAIRAAEEAGAATDPTAAVHLRLAREQVARAERLAEDKQHQLAALMFERATADAELAQALAQATTAEKGAHDTRTRARGTSEQGPDAKGN
jgi:pyridoxal biosynthesis lyase PdxS